MTKVAIWYPGSVIVNTGNFQTATRLKKIFESLGCSAELISDSSSPESADVLIAIHAEKSHRFVLEFKKTYPDAKVIVLLSGTDLYPELKEKSLETLRLADALVTLHPKGIELIPNRFQSKATAIVQSARKNTTKELLPLCSDEYSKLAIASHIRPVKGVITVAEASRLLPRESKLRFFHAGGELDEEYGRAFRREIEDSDRYTWLGELGHSETVNLIDNCDYLIVPSLAEGGAQVIGESIVNDTPLLATSIHGNLGLLGDDYPGLFTPLDSEGLAMLLDKLEHSNEFRQLLKGACVALKPNFDETRELNKWLQVVSELGVVLP